MSVAEMKQVPIQDERSMDNLSHSRIFIIIKLLHEYGALFVCPSHTRINIGVIFLKLRMRDAWFRDLELNVFGDGMTIPL